MAYMIFPFILNYFHNLDLATRGIFRFTSVHYNHVVISIFMFVCFKFKTNSFIEIHLYEKNKTNILVDSAHYIKKCRSLFFFATENVSFFFVE